MATPKVYVDGMLMDWSDTLFSPPYRPAKFRAINNAPWRLFKFNPLIANQARAQIDRTARKTPEVMVKITNKKGAGRGMRNIRNHLDYISRNGKIELENERGDLIESKAQLEDLKALWQYSSGKAIPEEATNLRNLRDAINIIFSMAAGTPPDKVKDAVREFLQEEFEGREYLFVLHTDKQHPHVHVCIKTTKTDVLKRLNPNRSDLQAWREGFALKLRENGIDANATPRRTRGETRLPHKQIDIHRSKRLGAQLIQKKIDVNLAPQFAMAQREAWKKITTSLNNSELPSDIALAKKVIHFWRRTDVAQKIKTNFIERKTNVQRSFERAWRFSASRILQSNSAQTTTAIQYSTDLRDLPSFNVASQQRKINEMFLYTNAFNYLGRRTSTDHGVRRTNTSASSTSGRGVTKDINTDKKTKR